MQGGLSKSAREKNTDGLGDKCRARCENNRIQWGNLRQDDPCAPADPQWISAIISIVIGLLVEVALLLALPGSASRLAEEPLAGRGALR